MPGSSEDAEKELLTRLLRDFRGVTALQAKEDLEVGRVFIVDGGGGHPAKADELSSTYRVRSELLALKVSEYARRLHRDILDMLAELGKLPSNSTEWLSASRILSRSVRIAFHDALSALPTRAADSRSGTWRRSSPGTLRA